MKTCLAASVAVVMLAAVLAGTSMAGRAQTPNRPAPTVRPAVDGIFAVFEKHPLVGMGDMHNMAQQEDFFVTLIRDPRLPKRLGMSSWNSAPARIRTFSTATSPAAMFPMPSCAASGATSLAGCRRSLALAM